MTFVTQWGAEQTQTFQKDVTIFQHSLTETGLFSDQALADLLDQHPSDLLDVCTRGHNNDPEYPNALRTGDFRGLSGQELIEAAKNGWVWINMRRAMNVHPDYKAVMDEMYAELSDQSGVKVFNPYGGILITSPVARTPYHFDKTEVVLWHIRGKKRLYVYPLEEKFISDLNFEELLVNPIKEDLPYRAGFDADAKIVDLAEGEAITWPLNSPHRVENSTFCVSVTTEYSTRASGMKNAAMLANAAMRHTFGDSSFYHEQGEVTRAVRSVFGRVIKKSGWVKFEKPKDMVSFKVDPAKPGCIVDIEPFERDF